MDLQITTQMLTSRNIKVLHLEPTDVCQAACPLCAREIDPKFNKANKNYLKVEYLDCVLPKDFISNLDKMFMCGNYGDPAASHYTHDIYNYFRRLNSGITLGMNTNGALQPTVWWQQLAKILNQSRDYVVFSIDGLEDTNANYRVNVNWQKLMSNVEAFISAGGQAHWDMLVYKHNQHQVDACQDLAKKLGFKWFRAKVSKRPVNQWLELPSGWANPNTISTNINCHALNEQSLYIDAQGNISPCCWLGARQNDFVTNFNKIQASWDTEAPYYVCSKTCGTNGRLTNFDNQWQREIQLC